MLNVSVTIIAAIRTATAYGWRDFNAALRFMEPPYVPTLVGFEIKLSVRYLRKGDEF